MEKVRVGQADVTLRLPVKGRCGTDLAASLNLRIHELPLCGRPGERDGSALPDHPHSARSVPQSLAECPATEPWSPGHPSCCPGSLSPIAAGPAPHPLPWIALLSGRRTGSVQPALVRKEVDPYRPRCHPAEQDQPGGSRVPGDRGCLSLRLSMRCPAFPAAGLRPPPRGGGCSLLVITSRW